MHEYSNELTRLKDLKDWKISDTDPDIRGWSVVDRNDDKIGEVDDLLVDTKAGKAPFAIVSYGEVLGMGGDSTLVPIERMQVDTDRKRLLYKGSKDDIENGPMYKKDTRDYNQFYDYWSGDKVRAREREREEAELVEGRKGGEVVDEAEMERRRKARSETTEGQTIEVPFEVIIRPKTNQ